VTWSDQDGTQAASVRGRRRGVDRAAATRQPPSQPADSFRSDAAPSAATASSPSNASTQAGGASQPSRPASRATSTADDRTTGTSRNTNSSSSRVPLKVAASTRGTGDVRRQSLVASGSVATSKTICAIVPYIMLCAKHLRCTWRRNCTPPSAYTS
jgi:hypothetical protein